ncbi:MAG TPA: hypothetical protein VI999_05320 [Thermoplasmata archaeon]|nr:hypothetical protein [Thermoplasmata archaeon]
MPKPIRSGPEFEAAFPVKGRVMQAILCECEKEGEIRLRIARDPAKGWDYDPGDGATYVDLHAYDPRGTYAKVRAGEWAEGRVVAFGYLKKVWAKQLGIPRDVLASGGRIVGEVHLDDTVEIDFGLFRATLAFEDEATRRKVVRDAGLKEGTFVATDVGLDVELKRWGPKESILKRR